jgi:homoserine dehydrogenase
VVSSAVRILILSFLFPLQEQIASVTVEGVKNVGEEDCIEIKTEEDYMQLVGRVKCEQEVSVLWWCVLW